MKLRKFLLPKDTYDNYVWNFSRVMNITPSLASLNNTDKVIDKLGKDIIHDTMFETMTTIERGAHVHVPLKDRSFVIQRGKEDVAKELIDRGLIYHIGEEDNLMIVGLTEEGILVYQMEEI